MRAWNPYFCLNSLNCNGFKPTFCVYRTTIILFHPFNPFNPCSFTTEFFFEHGFIGLTADAWSWGGTVFQTAVTVCCINPETSSRVTLASLGTGFQPDLPSMPLNNQKPTTHNPQPIYIYFYLLMFYDVWRGHYQLSEFHGS